MIYNIGMKIVDLLELDQAANIFEKYLPGRRKIVEGNNQAMSLSVEQFVRYTGVPNGEEVLAKMNEELLKLNTPENAISPSEKKMIEKFQKMWEEEQNNISSKTDSHTQDAIYPGQPWLDTKGERIQAHGGAVFYEDGIYYWYGENKTYTDGKNGIWTWGIKVYASTDLYNWEDKGYLIPPVLDDPNNGLFPVKNVDRPHILKCEKTGKYVCWIKLSGAEAAFSIWQADELLGTYELVKDYYRPGGYNAGDFDLITDQNSGKGYLYVEINHNALLCMELSEDYLSAEKECAYSYKNINPPFTREAPALFEYQNKKYMLTSGMTGYVPNKSDSAAADSWTDVFESISNPHLNDESCASFNSQISKIFSVAGKKDLFIAMADRWLPEYHVDARIADLFTRVIGSKYDPEHYQATKEEKQEMYAANLLETANTSVSDYVWLPIQIIDGKPVIVWREKWTIEELVRRRMK